jgi:hypothetical protein
VQVADDFWEVLGGAATGVASKIPGGLKLNTFRGGCCPSETSLLHGQEVMRAHPGLSVPWAGFIL